MEKICVHCGVELGEEVIINGKSYCQNCVDELFTVCDDCGEYVIENELAEVNNGNKVCEDCLNSNYTQCENCKDWFPDGETTEIHSEHYCDECRDDNFSYCDHCNEYENSDEFYQVGDEIWCRSCTDDCAIQCDDCGNYYHQNEMNEIDGGDICDSCRDNESYYSCENCGEVHHIDNMTYRNDGYYCADCRSNSQEEIGDYHSRECELTFYGDTNNNTVPFMGVELEIDNGHNNNETARAIKDCFESEFIYMEYDGSLCNGFENITQPATCEYHMSIAENYRRAFNVAVKAGYRAHQTDTCGLHVHFNRNFYGNIDEQDAGITRLLYLTEKFWDELTKFSRRKIRNLERWANKYNKEPQEIVADMKSHRVSRYYAVNLTNSATIEFRMFRGTLKLNTFLATLQLVNNLVIASKYIVEPEKLQALTWDYFINSDSLKAYWDEVKERVVR